ncbi:UNVERIFIED_CONTAM: hypothetical protein FKN15_070433 [Acipenser sinensis]
MNMECVNNKTEINLVSDRVCNAMSALHKEVLQCTAAIADARSACDVVVKNLSVTPRGSQPPV